MKRKGVIDTMPRPYHLGQRQQIIEQTRARIIAAARALLIAAPTYTDFSIDAIARQADVARMTVYHQFGTKLGLLEAVCDSLAANGGMEQLAGALHSLRMSQYSTLQTAGDLQQIALIQCIR